MNHDSEANAQPTAPPDFFEELKRFPPAASEILRTLQTAGAMLSAANCRELSRCLGLGPDALMIRLLPLARCFAVPTISDFYVGAVARGKVDPVIGWSNHYLGGNVEFGGAALSCVVHAEQAAVNHAWLRGEPGLTGLAVSAAPCGYCRQFLYELQSGKDLPILLADQAARSDHVTKPLHELLPMAFGPQDLDRKSGLMDPANQPPSLHLVAPASDPLIRAALDAAERCYAPYTGGFAGVALETSDGTRYCGRYAENAAYNPSLAPMQSAIAFMHVSVPRGHAPQLHRAALVEVPSKAGLRRASVAVLASFAPHLTLEYAEARQRSAPRDERE